MPPRTKQPLAVDPDPADEPRRAPRLRAPKPQPVEVTAVLVAHDGAAWLPEALAALAQSTRVPSRVVCVDTGSTDGSAELLQDAYGEVLRLPRETGFGAAVHQALATVEATPWVWLLHDDVAVEPGTLQALLEHAEESPSAVLLGPKVRDWNDPRYLVEVGITTDAAGHRETGLERREYDQGQHDSVRDVLAVGTAAALVRRDVWDQVGGLDPELPVFRDDLDLGWKVNAAGHRVVVVPEARVRHVRAATTGHRETHAAPGRATGIDRRNALFVLLAHASALRLVGLLPRLALATVFRSLGLLVTRQVADAGDEWRALLGALGRPGRLHAARRARARTRTVPQRRLRSLFVGRSVRMRARLGALGDLLEGNAPAPTSLVDPGPEATEFEDLDLSGGGALRRLLLRPGVLLVASVTALALLAERSLLTGGRLVGGALLAAPPGARDLWEAYVGAWHDVSVGTGQATPPGTAAVAALSTVLLGKPGWAVGLLVLGCVPLSAWTAYLAASRLVRHVYLRLWAAATWALLPVATGTVAAGRLDTAAVQVALPLLVLAAGRLLTDDPRVEGWWRVWALGAGLAATCAFAPLLWPLAAAVLVVGALANLAIHGGRRRGLAALLVAVVPGAVLWPWSGQALARPSLFVAGTQVAEPDVPGWHVLLLSPGGPGTPWVWVTAGLVAAALAGTVREAFRGLALVCWGVALTGYASAVVLTHVRVDGMPVWPGLALQVTALALLTSALVAANGARSRLARSSFGLRQLSAGVIAVLCLLLPVVAAGSWVLRGADDPVRRSTTQLLPPFAVAELQAAPGLRALLLSPNADGTLSFVLTDGDGRRLEDTGLRPNDRQRSALAAVVADLATARGSDAAEALSTRAVRYVALRHGEEALVAVLDAQGGLVRRTTGDVILWQVVAPAARLSLLPPATAQSALAGDRGPSGDLLRTASPQPLRAGREGARVTVPAGGEGRLVVLADAADPRWRATLDGEPLERRTAWGWAQGFVLPTDGGRLEVTYDQSRRHAGLVIQAVAAVAVLILAVPGPRRRRGLVEDVADAPEDTK